MYNYTMFILVENNMPKVTLTKWGNSMGIRIPSIILKEANLHPGQELEIKADEKGRITLILINNQQEGWLEKFNALADTVDEDHSDIANDFDMDEWTW